MITPEDLINLRQTLTFYAGEMALEPTETWETVEAPALKETLERLDKVIALHDQGYMLALVQYEPPGDGADGVGPDK